MSINKIEKIASELLPFFQKHLPKPSKVGRPSTNPHKVLSAILFMLKTGSQWSLLPNLFGKKSTIHGIYIKWSKAGIFKKVFDDTKTEYLQKQLINNWFAVDASHRKAPFAKFSGKSPVDRAKRGIKHVVIVDRAGVPLAVDIAPAHVHDSKLLANVIAQLPPSKNLRIIAADSAFDAKKLRSLCKSHNLILLACKNRRRNKNFKKSRVLHRWVVEQFFGISVWWRGLKICYSKFAHSALSSFQLLASIRIFYAL
jgi:transposase